MSVDDLNVAIRRNKKKEVLRLIDEEDVNVNGRNRVSFFSFFSSLSFLMILVWLNRLETQLLSLLL